MLRTKLTSFAVLGFLVFAAALPARLSAQAVGTILGTVTDPSGAVIPNAKVTAVQQGTGFSRSTVTSGSGTFFLTTLPVGTYAVSVEATSFKSASSQEGVALDVNQQREVNFTLALTESKVEVEVSAAPPLLTTTNATLGGLVTGKQVVTLPLNGRDITNLMLLQPGVQRETNSSSGFVNFVAGNGNRGTTGSSYLDGIDTTHDELGGGLFTNFNLDALDEFKILQNNYSAEYGRGSGTIIQQVSKSGTNDLHGSLFEFLRNDALDARNFFSREVPPFKRNEFGGTFGGPVWIPGVYNGKERTFFFAQYAGLRQRRGNPILVPVPTASEREGIVDIIGADGNPDQLRVPLVPDARTVLSQYPLPNQPNGVLGARTFNFQSSLPTQVDQWSARVDHRVSDKDSLFGRFSSVNNLLPITNPFAALINRSFSPSQHLNVRNFGLSETHVFSPTLLNAFRLGWTLTNDFFGAEPTGNPQATFTDGSIADWGTDGGGSFFLIHPMTVLVHDAISLTKGRHTLNFGGEFRRVHANETQVSFGGIDGVFFNNPGGSLPVAIPSVSGKNDLKAGDPSPSSLISFMAGAPAFYLRASAFPGYGPPGGGAAPYGQRRFHLNFWFQDDFKWTPKLTLNYGLRYEYNSVPYEVGGRASNIIDDPTFAGPDLFLRVVVNPKPFYRPDYRGWGPRFGFAYKLTEKTVLRGGYGIFTNLSLLQISTPLSGFSYPVTASGPTEAPFQLAAIPVNTLPPVVDLKGTILAANGDSKTVPPNTPVDLRPVQAFFGGPILGNWVTNDWKNGYTMAGNVTLEQALRGDMVFQVAYVTNNGVKLSSSAWPNGYTGGEPQYSPFTAVTPGVGEFQLTDSHAHSTYHSLQTMLRKTSVQHGLQFQISYTWSRAIDNASTVYNGDIANSALTLNDPTCFRCEKSVSSFDFPHRIVGNFVYALPFDKMKAMPKRITGGWQITGILQAQSGFPFTVLSPFGTQRFGTSAYLGTSPFRPDLVQTPTLNSGDGPQEQLFSNDVVTDGRSLGQKYFATPGGSENGVQNLPGNLGRNTFMTDSFSNVDFSVLKDTKITERTTIQFRAEFFNLFNQHAFAIPGRRLRSPGFGRSTRTVFPERQIQFGLRFIF